MNVIRLMAMRRQDHLLKPANPVGTARRRRTRPAQHSSRTGSVLTVVLVVAMPVLFVFAALAMDVGMAQQARQQLQSGVDAAALAAAAVLMEAAPPPPGWTSAKGQEEMLSQEAIVAHQQQVAAAHREAVRYAAWNPVLNRPIEFADQQQNLRLGDVSIGWVEDSTDLASEMMAATGVGPVNSVAIRAARTRKRGNPVSLLLGRAVGFAHMDVVAAARATVDQRLYGFRPAGTVRVPLVPVLVDARSGQVQLGSDGIREFTIVVGKPEQAGQDVKPRRGVARVIKVGGTQSDHARIQRQILTGLNTDDLVGFGGQFALTDEAPLRVTAAATPLRLAELRQSLLAIRGQKRAWPLGALSPNSTDETQCQVTGFAAGRVIDCRQVSTSNLVVVVQPCWLQTCSALTRPGADRNPWIGKLVLTR